MYLPVISRELRVSARQPFTYHLRALGVGAVLVASVFFGLQQGFDPDLGGRLFASLHFTLFWAIWILVPVLTADCISRERREGTLGLLFLTNLTGSDIVVAKGLAHGLRAFTLSLAVVPVVTIPFLLGGVSWTEVAVSALINISAMCWALAAGLLASAWNKVWFRAVLWAGAWAILFLVILCSAVGAAVVGIIMPAGFAGFQESTDFAFLTGIGFILGMGWSWASYGRLATPGQFVWGVGQLALGSMLALALAVLLAGLKTKRVWQEQPVSWQRVWLREKLCTPIFWLTFFRKWMRYKLERNPIGWLEQRTWTGRMVTWGWFAVVVSLYSGLLSDSNFARDFRGIQMLIGWLLIGTLALSTAGSFRRERESGVLELLLVSPLSERTLINGRLRGLWGQFLPSFGLLLGVWAYLSQWSVEENTSWSIVFFTITFLTTPVIGLYFSLRCRTYIGALLATFSVAILLPVMLPMVLRWMWFMAVRQYMPNPILAGSGALLFQFFFAAVCWRRLHERLVARAFPLQRSEA
ncbi:MAG TPA: hypothetical protein VLT36_07515 [Candidatus Dormibacteraeota bacterium]|nr:hypothetical protein [Candidatus Dormibacteraeota bacterium]